MSFGFAIGDFIAVGQLAWQLYRDCYMVARGAPQEFQLLLKEIQTLSGSLHILQEEIQDSSSTLVLAGEDRVRMVNEMVSRVEITLKELQKVAKKYKILETGSKGKKLWAKLSWSVELSSIDSLRSKVSIVFTRASETSRNSLLKAGLSQHGDESSLDICWQVSFFLRLHSRFRTEQYNLALP
jgi:hypothetical protein